MLPRVAAFGNGLKRAGKSLNERKTNRMLRNVHVLGVRVRRLASLVGLQRCPLPNGCEELERQQEPLGFSRRESQLPDQGEPELDWEGQSFLSHTVSFGFSRKTLEKKSLQG